MNIDTFIEKYIDDQIGKSFLITGANSGIGLATTILLAKKHARIYMACRSEKRAMQAIEDIKKIVPYADLHFVYYDQSKEDVILSLKIKMEKIHLDGIFLNAGIFHAEEELLHKVNVLGVKICYNALIKDHKDSRYVFTTSLVAKNKKGKSAISRYSKSKYELNEWVKQTLKNNDNLYLFHPGIAATSIAKSENSTYPKWFQKLAKWGMNAFFMKKEQACLGAVLALIGYYPKESYIYPRGWMEIRGYPKRRDIGGK